MSEQPQENTKSPFEIPKIKELRQDLVDNINSLRIYSGEKVDMIKQVDDIITETFFIDQRNN